MTDWQASEAVDFMLDECTTWAVVGLSGDTSRTAYRIAALLQERGKKIVPIHPDAPTVLGEQGYGVPGMEAQRVEAGRCRNVVLSSPRSWPASPSPR